MHAEKIVDPMRRVEASSYAIAAAKEFHKGKGPTLTEQKAQQNDGTMVTVVCITYGHEQFIAQALDSFIMQKTDFKFKVFVGEDHGPDGTADIVRDYAARYPDIIVPFIREKNMGAQRNLIDLCQQATSPYIALCEGDDYWVDENKLQRQVDYMESHPETRVCTTQTEILAPEDWHLRSWYRPVKGNRLLIPDSIPGFVSKAEYSAEEIINMNVAHTSTHFYRWNYDLTIPSWYYQGIIGDTPLLLLQLGTSRLSFLSKVTSVYRINEGSAFFDKDRERNFLHTRLDYIRYLTGLREFAGRHAEDYPIKALEDRIVLEAANYLDATASRVDIDTMQELFRGYPDAACFAVKALIDYYHGKRAMDSTYGKEGYTLMAKNPRFRHLMAPFVRGGVRLHRIWVWFKQKLRNAVALLLYWVNTPAKKKDDLWVFSGFNKKNYMDNSKYLYEYVLEHHPEIRAYWLTQDDKIYEKLLSEGKPVLKMRTLKCMRIVSHASVAVIDHFRMSDLDQFSGLNNRLKIVQLWHGVGLKAIGDLKNTTVPGVKFSQDILPAENDSAAVKFRKKLRYLRRAYYRELFERYFMLVCPGKERVEQVAKPLHIPLEACFFSGHPRNILLHTEKPDGGTKRILYAPTYRWNVEKEKQLVNMILENADMMQKKLEQCDAELTLRLHPHTWRNYSSLLNRVADQHDRIKVDQDKDIYTSLGKYSVLISDYSSIAYDFILLDRPVVFFNYDYEDFIATECKLNYDYDEYSPGKKTKTWEETLNAVEAYMKDPTMDSEWRRNVRDEFYDMSVNDEHNSERITQEIKRRLKK